MKKMMTGMQMKGLISSLLGMALALCCATVFAGDNEIAVSANVPASCTITAGDINFGDFTGPEKDEEGTVVINCPNGTAYTLHADAGDASDVALRQMNHENGQTTGTLRYNLYTDGTRATTWGDGTNSTGTLGRTGDGTDQTLTYYGRIDTVASPVAGSYSDLVTVSVQL